MLCDLTIQRLGVTVIRIKADLRIKHDLRNHEVTVISHQADKMEHEGLSRSKITDPHLHAALTLDYTVEDMVKGIDLIITANRNMLNSKFRNLACGQGVYYDGRISF